MTNITYYSENLATKNYSEIAEPFINVIALGRKMRILLLVLIITNLRFWRAILNFLALFCDSQSAKWLG